MRGPLFVTSCFALVFITATILDGEDRPMEKIAFALFLFGGLGCFGAWGYFNGMTAAATGLLVFWLLVLLSWGYRLDPESELARAQRAEWRKLNR